MTLTELRYLVALSETGHFRKAAEQCNVSQPTLSVAIKKLEEELGVALFERSRHRVSLTPIGEQVVTQARTVLREAGNLLHMAEQGKDPLGSILSVGAIFTVGPYLFPRLVSRLQGAAPDMPLFLEEGYTATLRVKLSTGALDAVFVALPFTEPEVVTKPIYDEAFVVLMRADHPLAGQKAISPGELAEQQVLLMGEGHCFRDQVLAVCPGLQQKIQHQQGQGETILEGSSLETLKHMVASGLGMTVIPQSAAALEIHEDTRSGLVVRPFSGEPPCRTIALAWRVSYPRHQAIDLLCEAAR